MKTVQERFEERFLKGGGDACWEWMGGKTSDGYGMISIDGINQGAHRIAYQLYIGEIPYRFCVCHRCDNPSCVRPDHLFLGTNTDNMHDCVIKGRHSDQSGENNGYSILIDEDVRIILAMHANGARNVDLAKQFGVAPSTISNIVCGRNWTK